MDTNRKLYVGNFPYRTTEEALRVLFEDYGEILSVEIITDLETGKSKGYAFIEMATPRAAEEALILNNFGFDGRRLRVGAAKPRKFQGGKGTDHVTNKNHSR